jgi:hypothetical protein
MFRLLAQTRVKQNEKMDNKKSFASKGFHCLETFGTNRNFTLNLVKQSIS